MNRVNAFDWRQGFPDAMNAGGFDCIIGNPPYGAALSVGMKEYAAANYAIAEYQVDSYVLFLERAVNLRKESGRLGPPS